MQQVRYPLRNVPVTAKVLCIVVLLGVAMPTLDHRDAEFDAAMRAEARRASHANASRINRIKARCGGAESSFRALTRGRVQCLNKHGRRTIVIQGAC